jgi:deoxycytidylate deaminase
MLINVGVERVVCGQGYPDELSVQMLSEAGMKLEYYGREAR